VPSYLVLSELSPSHEPASLVLACLHAFLRALRNFIALSCFGDEPHRLGTRGVVLLFGALVLLSPNPVGIYCFHVLQLGSM
jgi:hypothetical protein